MAAHFGRIAALANGRIPFDAKAAADNAEIAAMVSRLPHGRLHDGTDTGDTKVKPEIWARYGGPLHVTFGPNCPGRL